MKYLYVEINGKKVEYIHEGNGPVLLFLHGAFLRVKIFAPILKKLMEDYTVVAPNLPGHGKSDPAETMSSLTSISAHVNEFLNVTHINPRYVVGFSFGGGIALHLSLIRKIKKLVAIDPFVLPIEYPLHEFAKRYFVDIPAYWFNNGGGQSQFKEILRDTLGNAWDVKKHVPKLFDDFFKLYEKNGLDISKIKTETLLLWGKDDELFDSTVAYRLAAKNEYITHEILPGDHAWPLMFPDLFISRVKSYCRRRFFLWEWLFPKVRS